MADEQPSVDDSPPRRILVAYNLSAEADRAVEVVASAAWPPDAVVRLVTSTTDAGGSLSSFAGPREVRAHVREIRAAIQSAHEHATGILAAAGLAVESAIVTGAPGAAVVREAETSRADLIVTGGRLQSPMSATLTGSASMAIAERARCAVMIVRVQALARILLVTDGSDTARQATEVVARWPLFAGSDIRVVTVAEPGSSAALPSGIPTRSSQDPAARAIVETALDRLAAAGRHAEGLVRAGSARDEIVAAAHEWPADLVVGGTRGMSLIRSLILGSVARAVVQTVQSSVLVIRPSPREAPE